MGMQGPRGAPGAGGLAGEPGKKGTPGRDGVPGEKGAGVCLLATNIITTVDYILMHFQRLNFDWRRSQ